MQRSKGKFLINNTFTEILHFICNMKREIINYISLQWIINSISLMVINTFYYVCHSYQYANQKQLILKMFLIWYSQTIFLVSELLCFFESFYRTEQSMAHIQTTIFDKYMMNIPKTFKQCNSQVKHAFFKNSNVKCFDLTAALSS